MDWTHNTIWFEQLEEGEFQHIIFEKNEKEWIVSENGSYFILHDYKPKSKTLEELQGLNSSKYLEINRSNITSFKGISNLGKIKRLELHHCTKLENDIGISQLSNDIEWLHINTCRKFTFTNELLSLKNLKVLCLNDCAPIDNLEFLSSFPQLVDFRFVNTNIIDGNLKPLFEHPSLLNVGFLNKRHYNVKETEADAYFDPKSEANKQYVYKGQYATFKYNVFGK